MSIIWDNFPPPEESRQLLEDSLSESSDRPPVPYQFTIKVMGELFYSLSGVDRPNLNNKLDPPEPDYESVKAPQACPLRAIAYYSKDPYSSGFLTRRVFPRCFDFWSFSYVPPGWGALGHMFAEHVRRPFEPGDFWLIKNVGNRPRLLPYLFEAERLGYSSVVTLPILIEQDGLDIHVIGAMVFYLGSKDHAPEKDRKLKKRLGRFVSKFALLMEKHEEKIRSYPHDPESLQKESVHWRENKGFVGTIKIRVSHEDSNSQKVLRILVSVIGQTLATSPFHTTIEETGEENQARILVACSTKDQISKMENTVLTAVAKAIRGRGAFEFDYDGP